MKAFGQICETLFHKYRLIMGSTTKSVLVKEKHMERRGDSSEKAETPQEPSDEDPQKASPRSGMCNQAPILVKNYMEDEKILK